LSYYAGGSVAPWLLTALPKHAFFSYVDYIMRISIGVTWSRDSTYMFFLADN